MRSPHAIPFPPFRRRHFRRGCLPRSLVLLLAMAVVPASGHAASLLDREVSVQRKDWFWSGVPFGQIASVPDHALLDWYTPPNAAKERDLDPTLTWAEGAEDTHPVLELAAFNPGTVIEYELRLDEPVQLEIYDVAGRKIATLVGGPQAAGPHRAAWSGRDDRGRAVPSGVYFYRLRIPGRDETRRMVLLK